MSLHTDVQLRRLVEGATQIKNATTRPKPSQHPLGIGLDRRKSYPHPSGLVPLPTIGEGLERLKAEVERSPYGLHESLREAAWNALLGKPGLVAPLRDPSVAKLLERGIAASDRSRTLFRQVGLATVVRAAATSDHGEATIGATAILTVRLSPRNARSADDAWLDPSWSTTTRAFSVELERIVDLGLPSAVARGRRRAVVLIAEQMSGELTPDLFDRIKLAGAVFGYEFQIVDRARVTHGDVLKMFAAQAPNLVIAVGPHDDALESLRHNFNAATAQGGAFFFLTEHRGEEVVQQLRELLADHCGVMPGLTIRDGPISRAASRAPLPISSTDRCLHDEFERFYARDPATSLWWTRDTAGHAGSVFKTYREEGGKLVHEACHDQAGRATENNW